MIRIAGALIVIVLLMTGCSGLTFKVPTVDMAPTINPGDSVAVDPTFYKLIGLERFDIVAVEDPEGKLHSSGRREMYVKRVIALGGEKFEIRNNRFYINGRETKVPFTIKREEPIEDFGPVMIPEGEIFVVGDNISNSVDSRYWRPSTIKPGGVYGRVTVIKDGATGATRNV